MSVNKQSILQILLMITITTNTLFLRYEMQNNEFLHIHVINDTIFKGIIFK